jgi:hypothetical protein
MEMPNIRNTIKDERSRITYVVLAYRQLTREEVVDAVRYYQSRQKKKPKPGTEITIITTIGAV